MQIQRRKRLSLLTPRSLLILGTLSAVIGTWGFRNDWDYAFRAEPIDAVVSAVKTEDTGTFTIYTPTVELTLNGALQTLTVARSYRGVVVGEKLVVFSDPDNPTDIRLMDPRDIWLLPAWAILFGFVSLAMAYDRTRREAAERAREQGHE